MLALRALVLPRLQAARTSVQAMPREPHWSACRVQGYDAGNHWVEQAYGGQTQRDLLQTVYQAMSKCKVWRKDCTRQRWMLSSPVHQVLSLVLLGLPVTGQRVEALQGAPWSLVWWRSPSACRGNGGAYRKVPWLSRWPICQHQNLLQMPQVWRHQQKERPQELARMRAVPGPILLHLQ